jgi:Tfp pilus assembly protein PilN
MLQINLLPDIKQEHIKSQQLKQTVVTMSILVAIGALTVLVLLFVVVNVLQKKHLSDLNTDIASYTKELKDTPDLDKILTVQNQLNSLTSLHDKKPAATRLFKYIGQVVPSKASISTLNVDFDQTILTITGTADSVGTINRLVDTLKFTTFSDNTGVTDKKAFSDVVLSSFSKADKDRKANYAVNLKFDSSIFDITKEVKLTVPAQVTTRSSLNSPLFNGSTKKN